MSHFERYLLFIIGAICFVSLITFLLPYSIKIDEIETFNWILGLDINKPLNLGNDLETIWIAGLFPWGVLTKSKLFINRLITPVFRLNRREVFLKGFILISLTLLFIFFTYPLFNKYIVDILCTTISVLIFSFILDKGKLSDLKPIRYMQIILFTYIGTFLFVLFVLFIYQYILDSLIYCAPPLPKGDIVSTEVVTTPLEGLLDNTITSILWLSISLGLFSIFFFIDFFLCIFLNSF